MTSSKEIGMNGLSYFFCRVSIKKHMFHRTIPWKDVFAFISELINLVVRQKYLAPPPSSQSYGVSLLFFHTVKF